MSRVLRFPCRTLEELRADELAILEDLAETRRRIADFLEGERGSERKHPKNARGGAQEARPGEAVPSPSPARDRAATGRTFTTGGERE